LTTECNESNIHVTFRCNNIDQEDSDQDDAAIQDNKNRDRDREALIDVDQEEQQSVSNDATQIK
jgi:hypothetical protein